MPTIIFRKNFEVKKELFSEKLIEDFPFANEFYTAIFVEEGDFKKEIIEGVLGKKDIKKEYSNLNDEEKIEVQELLLSILKLTPEFINKKMEILLDKNSIKNLKRIKSERKKIVKEFPYFSLCKPEKYFVGIIEGELACLEEDFLFNKKYSIIK